MISTKSTIASAEMLGFALEALRRAETLLPDDMKVPIAQIGVLKEDIVRLILRFNEENIGVRQDPVVQALAASSARVAPPQNSPDKMLTASPTAASSSQNSQDEQHELLALEDVHTENMSREGAAQFFHSVEQLFYLRGRLAIGVRVKYIHAAVKVAKKYPSIFTGHSKAVRTFFERCTDGIRNPAKSAYPRAELETIVSGMLDVFDQHGLEKPVPVPDQTVVRILANLLAATQYKGKKHVNLSPGFAARIREFLSAWSEEKPIAVATVGHDWDIPSISASPSHDPVYEVNAKANLNVQIKRHMSSRHVDFFEHKIRHMDKLLADPGKIDALDTEEFIASVAYFSTKIYTDSAHSIPYATLSRILSFLMLCAPVLNQRKSMYRAVHLVSFFGAVAREPERYGFKQEDAVLVQKFQRDLKAVNKSQTFKQREDNSSSHKDPSRPNNNRVSSEVFSLAASSLANQAITSKPIAVRQATGMAALPHNGHKGHNGNGKTDLSGTGHPITVEWQHAGGTIPKPVPSSDTTSLPGQLKEVSKAEGRGLRLPECGNSFHDYVNIFTGHINALADRKPYTKNPEFQSKLAEEINVIAVSVERFGARIFVDAALARTTTAQLHEAIPKLEKFKPRFAEAQLMLLRTMVAVIDLCPQVIAIWHVPRHFIRILAAGDKKDPLTQYAETVSLPPPMTPRGETRLKSVDEQPKLPTSAIRKAEPNAEIKSHSEKKEIDPRLPKDEHGLLGFVQDFISHVNAIRDRRAHKASVEGQEEGEEQTPNHFREKVAVLSLSVRSDPYALFNNVNSVRYTLVAIARAIQGLNIPHLNMEEERFTLAVSANTLIENHPKSIEGWDKAAASLIGKIAEGPEGDAVADEARRGKKILENTLARILPAPMRSSVASVPRLGG